MTRKLERAGWLAPDPADETPCWTSELRLLQAQDKGDMAAWRRQDLRHLGNQPLATEPVAEGQEGQQTPVRDPELFQEAQLQGAEGGQSQDKEPGPEGAEQRATTRHQQTKAALREEGGHQEGLAWHPKTGMKVTSTSSVTRAAQSPLSKRRGPSGRTSGGRQHPDPWVNRGEDVDKLCPEDREPLGDGTKEVAQDRRRQLGKEVATFTHYLKPDPLESSREARRPEQGQWPVGLTRRKGAVCATPVGRPGGSQRWHRELEFAFEELFATNRKLKAQLGLHLEQKPRKGQSLTADQGPRKAEMGATPTQDNLKTLLAKIETQKYHRLAKTKFDEKSKVAKASRKQEDAASPPRSWPGKDSPKSTRLVEGGQLADGGGRGTTEAKQTPEATALRRQKTLELLEQTEHPKMSPFTVHGARQEARKREQRKAPSKATPMHSLDFEGALGPGSTPSLVGSSLDDSRHSQMIVNLQQQIIEQNKVHRQFLEEARKRLQEFQKIC
ncbi:protein DDC8 homolog [Echinops telfairi]|uniref:Protein DDC8 homolog n=1 Tax=Echinops telfairi TaxID=9371 RepID=A0ABM0IWF5_ECHTE|nr:protein DDC8 homolog [Echinops telfairi]